MRKINKGEAPESLNQWKRANPTGQYSDVDAGVKQSIRITALQEQGYLCAYCCVLLSGDGDCHNEHVVAQSLSPKQTVEFSNIVVSCNAKKQCGNAHGSKLLPVTPFMDACETELKFSISGRVKGLTERATKMIKVLNLGDSEQQNRALIEKRKQLAEVLLWRNGVDPKEGLDDDELIAIVIDDILQPVNGKFESFAPVVANILRGWSAP